MTKFFVNPEELTGNPLFLTGENANHAKVLRLKAGEQVLVCNGQGEEWLCSVDAVTPSQTQLTVLEQRQCASEPGVQVSVYMAFSKGDKLEHVIQKAAELGATEIVTFPTARCISRPDQKSLAKKLERWQKIALSAAEQSGRGIVPVVRVCNHYKDALQQGAQAALPILFYENETATTLHMALASAPLTSLCLLTGPEGGFEEWEVAQAMEAGFRVCTLGSRILRCETAPLCALSAVMYAAGEF